MTPLEKLKQLDNIFPSPETWIQKVMRKGEARCFIQAMHECHIFGFEEYTGEVDKAYEAILKATGAPRGNIGAIWNDAPERTFKDVKRIIYKAIALVKEEANGTP
jgi:hypothetical protein